MTDTPNHLQDAKSLLSADGFATCNIWYHGTSSALLNSIKESGLNRSGDRESNTKAKNTLKTIGDTYQEGVQPVFLTQSKELAFIWAVKTVEKRSVRFEGEEMPIVLAVTLGDDVNEKVKTDVGAAGMIMVGSDDYIEQVGEIYQANGLAAPEIDPATADRMDYLNKLGMAYINTNIPAECVKLVSE